MPPVRKRGATDNPEALPPAARRRLEEMQARIQELEARQERVSQGEIPGTSGTSRTPAHVRVSAGAAPGHSAVRVQAAVAPNRRAQPNVQYPRILGLPPHDPATLHFSHPGYIVETAPGAIRIMEAITMVATKEGRKAVHDYTRSITGRTSKLQCYHDAIAIYTTFPSYSYSHGRGHRALQRQQWQPGH